MLGSLLTIVTLLVLLALLMANGPTADAWRLQYLPWIEPLATICAFLAASCAVIYASKAYGREVARDQVRMEADKRSQATLIAAWPVVFETALEGGATSHTGYIIRNASQLPVYDVEVLWKGGAFDDGLKPYADRHALVPPSSGGYVAKQGRPYDLLPGEVMVHGEELWSPGGGAGLIGLRFRDAADIIWERDSRGRLHMVRDAVD